MSKVSDNNILRTNQFRSYKAFVAYLNMYEVEGIELDFHTFTGNAKEDLLLIAEYNKMINYLKENGQHYTYCLPRDFPMDYNAFMRIEDEAEKISRVISERLPDNLPQENNEDKLYIDLLKARVIEREIGKTLTVAPYPEQIFFESLENSLYEAIVTGVGSCRHFAVLSHYLHTRVGMHNILVRPEEITVDGNKYRHVFNLLLLGETYDYATFSDPTYSWQYTQSNNYSDVSFATYEGLQAHDKAHNSERTHMLTNKNNGNIFKKIKNFSVDETLLNAIDNELGYIDCEYLRTRMHQFLFSYDKNTENTTISLNRNADVCNNLLMMISNEGMFDKGNVIIRYLLEYAAYLSVSSVNTMSNGNRRIVPSENYRKYCQSGTYSRKENPEIQQVYVVVSDFINNKRVHTYFLVECNHTAYPVSILTQEEMNEAIKNKSILPNEPDVMGIDTHGER